MRIAWRTNNAAETTTLGSHDTLNASSELPGRIDLATEMLRQHRCVLLLRPRLASDLDQRLLTEALAQLHELTCEVPAGRVTIDRWQVDELDWSASNKPSDASEVETFRLQRYAVTNAQFQAFVDHGGYRHSALWNTSVWPRINEFVDRTGSFGPRYWRAGKYETNEAEHPVVGVNWFEAEAYARWIGMRLPSDSEWVRAACAPIESDQSLIQRKYPWGDRFTDVCANLRDTSDQRLLPVHALADGDSAFGARQMVGNVWEWTSGNATFWNRDRVVEASQPLKTLRGGAFDAQLENQATCQVCSADSPLARRHNVGFRCAVTAADLVCLDALASAMERG